MNVKDRINKLKETDNFKNKGSTIKRGGGGSGGGDGHKMEAPMFDSREFLGNFKVTNSFRQQSIPVNFDAVSNRKSAVLVVLMPTATAALSTA